MPADPDQCREVGHEQFEVGTQVSRYVLPGRLQRVVILRAVEVLAVYADRPFADRIGGDAALGLQPRQQMSKVVPVFELVIELAEQAERVAVIA
jgi:hypothetical protein